MFENLFYSTQTVLGLIIIIIHLNNYKTNRFSNVYFIILLFLNTLRSACFSLPEISFLSTYQSNINLLIQNYCTCLFYMYLTKIIYNQKNHTIKEKLHLIVPLTIMVICYTNIQNKDLFSFHPKFNTCIITALNVGYFIAIVILIVKNVFRRNRNFIVINPQNQEIKKWILLLFSLFLILFLKGIYVAFFNYNQYNLNCFTPLIWTIIYTMIFCTPEFLYGYKIYIDKNKEYKKTEIVFDNIWIFKNNNQINKEDVLLKEKIKENIEEYIISIEYIALNTEYFLNETIKIRDLANKLNIPKSHLKYIFKFHSTINFIDFKILVRIQNSTLLIKQGYLKNNKFESLAKKVGFLSYSTFFKNFKSITGMSPNEFKRKNDI